MLPDISCFMRCGFYCLQLIILCYFHRLEILEKKLRRSSNIICVFHRVLSRILNLLKRNSFISFLHRSINWNTPIKYPKLSENDTHKANSFLLVGSTWTWWIHYHLQSHIFHRICNGKVDFMELSGNINLCCSEEIL